GEGGGPMDRAGRRDFVDPLFSGGRFNTGKPAAAQRSFLQYRLGERGPRPDIAFQFPADAQSGCCLARSRIRGCAELSPNCRLGRLPQRESIAEPDWEY